jgi:hypothetical protein
VERIRRELDCFRENATGRKLRRRTFADVERREPHGGPLVTIGDMT